MMPVRSEILTGSRRAAPVVIGYLPVGFAFGVLVVQNGMPPWMAVLTSIIVYAGSAQLIAADLLGVGTSAATLILTTFIVNLRHLLMSTALTPWLSQWPRSWLACFGLELTDEVFALHSQQERAGHKPKPAALFACNIIAHVGWVTGTALGAFSGDLLGDTRPFGLDFTLSAMFIALIVPQVRGRLHLAAACTSALLATLLTMHGAGQWAAILATVCTASLAGYAAHRHSQNLERQELQ